MGLHSAMQKCFQIYLKWGYPLPALKPELAKYKNKNTIAMFFSVSMLSFFFLKGNSCVEMLVLSLLCRASNYIVHQCWHPSHSPVRYPAGVLEISHDALSTGL